VRSKKIGTRKPVISRRFFHFPRFFCFSKSEKSEEKQNRARRRYRARPCLYFFARLSERKSRRAEEFFGFFRRYIGAIAPVVAFVRGVRQQSVERSVAGEAALAERTADAPRAFAAEVSL
jgi:hypothetical protein